MKAAYWIPAIAKLKESYKIFTNRQTVWEVLSPAQQVPHVLHVLTGSPVLEGPTHLTSCTYTWDKSVFTDENSSCCCSESGGWGLAVPLVCRRRWRSCHCALCFLCRVQSQSRQCAPVNRAGCSLASSPCRRRWKNIKVREGAVRIF